MTLSFFIPGKPIAQPRVRACRRGAHAGVYDPGTADGWRECVMIAAKEALKPHAARPLFTGPVCVHLQFVFPRPKAHFNSKGTALKASAPLWHTQKPDRDNLEKAVNDSLSNIEVWKDDTQVCDGTISKRFAAANEACGCYVSITSLEPTPT